MSAPTLQLDARRRIVRRNGVEVKLGPTGFRILELLVKAPDGLERAAIFERAFLDRDDGGPSDDCFNVHVSMLRRKLAAIGLRIPKSDRWGCIYLIEEPRP
jgi:DNA-binding response OmpR family regulator